MSYSEEDIENLDKIIIALAKSETSVYTVPEILYGYQEYPPFGSPENLDSRVYEDVLIKNKICSVTDGWTPNSVPGGYKTIYLDNAGWAILRFKKSIQDFLEKKQKPTLAYTGPYNLFHNSLPMEKYESFDLILNHIINTNQGHSNNIKYSIEAFKDVDPSRIDLLLEQMYSLAPGAFNKKTFQGRPAIFKNNYTHLIKEEGGFKVLLEKREKEAKNQHPSVSFHFNNSGDGNVINTGNNSFVKAEISQGNSGPASTPEALKAEIQELTTQIKYLLDKIISLEADSKEEIVHQTEVVERQAAKDKPNFSLIGKALQMIESLLMDAVSNEYTPLILEGIRSILPQLAK